MTEEAQKALAALRLHLDAMIPFLGEREVQETLIAWFNPWKATPSCVDDGTVARAVKAMREKDRLMCEMFTDEDLGDLARVVLTIDSVTGADVAAQVRKDARIAENIGGAEIAAAILEQTPVA